MSNKIDFTDHINPRIERLEKELEYLVLEKDICLSLSELEILGEDGNGQTFVATDKKKQLEAIKNKQRAIQIENEIVSKSHFLNGLKEKLKIDNTEFTENLKIAKAESENILEKVNEYLDQEEIKTNNVIGFTASEIQYYLNCLIFSIENKQDKALVFWFNALKKKLIEVKIIKA